MKLQRRSRDDPAALLYYEAQGPVLHEFHRSVAFIKGVIGPLGSGKTFGAINEILHCIHNQVPDRHNVRRSRWCVSRNSFPDLNSATIPDFRSIVDHLPFGKFTMGSPPKWEATYSRSDGTKVSAEVLFRSFDGPQDIKKIKGMQLTGAWVDELGEFNKQNFDHLVGRVTRFPPKVQVPNAEFGVLFTSNAVARDHWLAELALGTRPHNWWVGLQPPGVLRVGNTWVENPDAENRNNLAKDYYFNQIASKKESWVRQNLANEFVFHGDGQPIHPDFNEHLHTDDLVALHGIPLHLGMDWGRTPACVIMQCQPNGQWFVLEEICLKNAGADKLGTTVKRALNARYAGFTIMEATGDPAGTAMSQSQDETPFDLFELKSELQAVPAHTNDPEVRYATLDNQLTTLIEGQPAIVVDRSCTTLIAGLAGEYNFKRIQVTGEERYHNEPNKGGTSHICEALHYCLMGAGESDILFNHGMESIMDELADVSIPDSIYE